LRSAGFDKVVTVGSLMKNLRAALPENMLAPHCSDKSGVIAALKSTLQNNDVVLFKASNSVGLGITVKNIKEGVS